jgi:hypothetical protein
MGMSHVSFISEYLKIQHDEGSVMLKERLKKYEKKLFVSTLGPLLKEGKEKGECSFAASAEVLAIFIHQLEQGVNDEIKRVFAEEPKPKIEAIIIDIMKAYVYALSRLLNASPEAISDLINLEESMLFYKQLLTARK